MQCPSNNAVTKNSAVDTYKKFASNILKLVELDEVPLPLNEKIINETADFDDFLLRNNAKYHKNCKRHFDNDRVKRAEGRAQTSGKKVEYRPHIEVHVVFPLSKLKEKHHCVFFVKNPKKKGKNFMKYERFDLMQRFVGLQSIRTIR